MTVIPPGRSEVTRSVPMLDFTQEPGKPHLRLLVRHDDADREFSYTSGAEESLAKARVNGWTIVSMRTDWARVF